MQINGMSKINSVDYAQKQNNPIAQKEQEIALINEENENIFGSFGETSEEMGKNIQISKIMSKVDNLRGELKEMDTAQRTGEDPKASPKTSEQQKEEKTSKQNTANKTYADMSEDEKQMIASLQARDTEVRTHEAAHMAAGGALAGGASYTYQKGPDGKNYAIGGEVPITVGGGNTPQETIANMQQARAAALAPANPSGADLAIAAKASQGEAQARAQLSEQQANERVAQQEEAKINKEQNEAQVATKEDTDEQNEDQIAFNNEQSNNQQKQIMDNIVGQYLDNSAI